MITLTNVELNVNLYSPVIFFDLEGKKYAIFTDDPDKVLTGEMDGVCDVLSSQLQMNNNSEDESTTFKFNDFHIIASGGVATGALN
ncbi:hypothetical protein CW745_03325 [Psychromonas sp. psych-6C06]|uniref:hypothetical protein n=1 Tax=Psychromonas sp. psych-6C06 TaxID=2058089 RepID=UPI000C33FA15|nr:hypothetical protein [Psychromonas sp. psych-6C06]PKF62477.1 hypothetical protein CW745_03325 [Psychromonas sp. psych-6C06]